MESQQQGGHQIKNILNFIIPKPEMDITQEQKQQQQIPQVGLYPPKLIKNSNIQEKRQIQLTPLIIQNNFAQQATQQKMQQNPLIPSILQKQLKPFPFMDSQSDIQSALTYGNSASTLKHNALSKEHQSVLNQIDSSTKFMNPALLSRKQSLTGDNMDIDISFPLPEAGSSDSHMEFLQNLLKLDSSTSLEYAQDAGEIAGGSNAVSQENSQQALDSPSFHKQLLQTMLKNYYQEKKHQQIKEQQQQQQILQLYQLYQNSKQKSKQPQQINNMSPQQQLSPVKQNLSSMQQKLSNENLSIHSIVQSEEKQMMLQSQIQQQQQIQQLQQQQLESQQQQLQQIQQQLPIQNQVKREEEIVNQQQYIQNHVKVKEENLLKDDMRPTTTPTTNTNTTIDTTSIKVEDKLQLQQQQYPQQSRMQTEEYVDYQEQQQQQQQQQYILNNNALQQQTQQKQQSINSPQNLIQAPQQSGPTNQISRQIQENIQKNTTILPPAPQKIEKNFTCNCRKTKCLKLYCECFGHGESCGPNCNCVGCSNDSKQQNQSQVTNNLITTNQVVNKQNNINQPIQQIQQQQSQQLQQQQQLPQQQIQHQQPSPQHQIPQQQNQIVQNQVKKKFKGCNCRKSNCLKKYCECYMQGLECGKGCNCFDCHNNKLAKLQKHSKLLNPGYQNDQIRNQQYLNQFKMKEEHLQSILSTVKAQSPNPLHHHPHQYMPNPQQQLQQLHILNAQKKVQEYHQQQQQNQLLLDNILLKKKLKEENQVLFNAMKMGKQYFDGLERAAIIENQYKQYLTAQEKQQNMQLDYY